MPELRFVLRWPDGTAETCYSPSTIVRDHFDPRHTLPDGGIPDAQPHRADRRQRPGQAIYGTPCSLALGQLARIETAAAR